MSMINTLEPITTLPCCYITGGFGHLKTLSQMLTNWCIRPLLPWADIFWSHPMDRQEPLHTMSSLREGTEAFDQTHLSIKKIPLIQPERFYPYMIKCKSTAGFWSKSPKHWENCVWWLWEGTAPHFVQQTIHRYPLHKGKLLMTARNSCAVMHH